MRIMGKILSRNQHVVFWLLFLFLYAAGIAYAVPPSTKYNPGETLDPNCAPGDTNCSVSLATIWGNITGTLSDQTDLANALAGKQDSITLGTTAQYLRGDLSLATFPTALSDFTNDENFITDNIYNADGSLTGDRTVDLDGHSLYIHGGSDTSLTLDPENGTSNLVASDSNYLSNGELSGLFLTANTSNGGGSSFALLAQADFGTHAGIGGDAISGILELTGGNGVDQITYLDVENDGVKISNLAGNGSGCVGVDNDGLLSWTDCSGGGVSSNIYTADGSLTGDRTVSLADNVLNFQSNIYDNNNDSGVVFSIDPSDNTYTDLYDFTDDSSGQGPYAGLVLGPDGKYYGTTSYGGGNGDGVIYSINPADSYAYADQFDFTVASGYSPSSTLILGTDDKLYGVTSDGGAHYGGTIFSFDPSSGIYSRLYSFDSPSGSNPNYSTLVYGNDGKFYGTTQTGGAHGYGAIFSFDPSDNTYTDLYDLSYSTGASVYGSLILGSDGKFYDTTQTGGANGYGAIFSFDPSDNTYTDLYDLNYSITGGYPYAGLVLGNDGKFYGTTYAGGPGSSGVIFSFDPLTTTYTVLHNFESDTGADPYAPLTLGSDGKFYGTTYVGGANSYGAIFSYDPNADIYIDIYDFNYDRGANPYTAPLLQGDDGKIYGTTPNGGGVDEGPNNYLSVYPSNDEVSINTSGAGLDVNGPFVSIYSNEGTSFYGDGEVDFNNAGSIVASNGGYVGFGYDTDGFYNALDASNTKVYIQGSNQGGEEIINGDFSSFDDNWDLGYGWEVSGDQAVFTPYDGTIQQDLYEVPNGGQGLGYQVGDTLTVDGGDENAVITVDDVDDNGAITDWEVTTPGTGYELYSTYNLTGGSGDSAELSSGDGGDAYTHLTQSAPDDIENNVKYTVSLDVGGDTGSVEVCLNDGDCDEFDAGQGSVSFDGYWNEDEDTDILAIYPSDDFNGTIDNVSVIRKTQNALTVSGNTVLEDLSGNGSSGCAGVDNNGLLSWSACGIYAANGSLASTRTLSLAGHALNFNNLSIGSGATALNDLYTFDSDHGGYPIGTMILGGDGKFYGVASLGANSDGVIFSYDPDTDTYADLYDFNGFEGSDPESELVRIHNKFYGVARQGGGYNRGVIFSYDPSTDTYMDIYDFRSSGGDAKYPTSLMLAANGTLYGTTDGGGANGDGAIFSYNPTTSDYTKLYDFDSDFGSEPGTTLIQDLDGILYGVANSGGAYGDGVIFSYNPATYTYTDLYDFDGTNGSYADSALVFYDGVLYGSTDGGGDNDYGVIFSYDPDSEIFTKLHDFDGTNGSYPYKNNMLLGSNGLFYGMASGGGANDAGVIYSFDPD
ncbi:MAG TPA: choice-of-anchor tandem repeat GloVer-containing protein, partial [Candidatus Paceibacterota bacterium]|nr:choice-of-anchor tandem repeat GloVer-containing protein [Candidatus Paceibacterota bacterium]